MTTFRMPIMGWGAIPDSSGDCFFEPYDILATNDVWDRMIGRFGASNSAAPTLRAGVHGGFAIPKNYVGTAVLVIVWTSTVTTNAVVWDFDYRAVGGDDTESLDQAGTQETVTVTDTGPSAANERMEATISLTSGNFAVDDEVTYFFCRDGTDAADTKAGSALLFNLLFQYNDVEADMARLFVAASTQRGEFTTIPVTAYPFTMAVWFKPTTSNAFRNIFCLGHSTTTNRYFGLAIADASGHIDAGRHNGGTEFFSTSTGTVTNGTWAHVAGVFLNATSMTSYLNGTASTTNTSSVTFPTGLNRTTVGALNWGGTYLSYADGTIAEAAIWNVQLNATELAALAKGVSPLMIRRSALVFYAPIWGNASPEPDRTNGIRHLTLTAAPAAAAHVYTEPYITPAEVWLPYAVTAAGTTYDKLGTAVAGTKATGAEQWERARQNTATSEAHATGADVAELSRQNTATSRALISGADVAELSRQNTATSRALISGADVAELSRQNTATSRALQTGASEKVVGGVETAKTGTATAGTIATGTDAEERARQNIATAGTIAAGADAAEHSRTNIATSRALVSGTDVAEHSRQNTAAIAALVPGADVAEHGRANTATSAALASGTSSKVVGGIETAKTGTAVAGATATGTDAAEHARQAIVTSAATATGADASEHSRQNTATSATRPSGADSTEVARTSTATAGTIARGVSQAGFISRTGTASSQAVGFGGDAFTASRTGTSTSAAAVCGGDAFTAARTGTTTSRILATGTSTKTSPTTWIKAGTATTATIFTAQDALELSRTGTTTTRALATGPGIGAPAIPRWEADPATQWPAESGTRWDQEPATAWAANPGGRWDMLPEPVDRWEPDNT